MSATLKLTAPASSAIVTEDPHTWTPEVVRFGALWRSEWPQSDVRVVAVLTNANDKLVEQGIVSAETPSAYDGAACLVRPTDRPNSKAVEYISISKTQLPAEVDAVHVFCYSLYDGMFAPFNSLSGELCTNMLWRTLLDDERMPWGFDNFNSCTAALGVRLCRGNSRWVQSIENNPVHLPVFLSRLGVTLVP
jgi:hypothetical protein